TPNTFDAHRLIWWADQNQAQDAVVEALFRAFFIEGRDVGDRRVLAEVAGEAGLNRPDAASFLGSDRGTPEVSAEEARARTFGVEAVPFFVLDRRVAVAGAHPPERFVEAFEGLERPPAACPGATRSAATSARRSWTPGWSPSPWNACPTSSGSGRSASSTPGPPGSSGSDISPGRSRIRGRTWTTGRSRCPLPTDPRSSTAPMSSARTRCAWAGSWPRAATPTWGSSSKATTSGGTG